MWGAEEQGDGKPGQESPWRAEVPAGRQEGEVRAKWSWDQKLERQAG